MVAVVGYISMYLVTKNRKAESKITFTGSFTTSISEICLYSLLKDLSIFKSITQVYNAR